MTRIHSDWLASFMDYAGHGEAPKYMYFWVGVSTIAGALRRHVWIDQAYFRWYPNFYICLVGPPGIVSKTTTVSTGMKLLHRVEGVKFGPDVVTWPALVDAFEAATEAFPYQGAFHPMSALTLESGEFGNLLDPNDRAMVDLLVTLWDGKEGAFTKSTKASGSNSVENPWINLIACTTPSWIAGNFPEYMVGGGFTSRMIFVYADAKAKYVAYPKLHVPADHEQRAKALVTDLQHIATNLVGEYRLSASAIEWGEAWYKYHYTNRSPDLADERFGGYIARKQTHIHKLGMILAAASSDEMLITDEHLSTAHTMVTDLEHDMQFVFSKIGRSDSSVATERLIAFVHLKGKVTYMEAYRYIHVNFPSLRDFEDIMTGCIAAGYIKRVIVGTENWLHAGRPLDSAQNGRKSA